ncbi:bifunctional 2-C-methyl-D-erythritol 4-phosphate cytidylyltransferase/2-C-methyl-D-erythritol 2,4-cyclodiphosphate synthase [Pelagibius sp. Alg239-R121]|uniref:bifunctional 2-C-methyl-D-erythritol 4-phosphate cytidylyltransferase/2-C-methyl-D-erythritol 2,4-cyclodiphosphate synthase n=1 Tax=Pelagibius sp. Alg239-R121 TaxID=2993448 RepID=UPI0024A76A90|nr:bifunctional 2-C-methyl-D-erythritol 4-phosphate cytidylyltransferase/2-C-methyl-D-erythritol 2,4-cyclodiphosphate synthase [Pelagibius sp. Alg239-R121]
MTGVCALIVAAGRGQRFGGEVPKQYAALAGRSVLRHAVDNFLTHPDVDHIQVVIHPDDRALYEQAIGDIELPSPALGGKTRQESVRLGLESLAAHAPEKVLIHDAARPFVPKSVIDAVIQALDQDVGAVAALPVVDSLKRGDADTISGTVERTNLWRAQTPQGFRFQEILTAHSDLAASDASDDEMPKAGGLTDDAAVAQAAGHSVKLIEGATETFKVTTAEDLARAERWLNSATLETRTGNGFDVHRFGPGDAVTLCGVKIAHSGGLQGHSDADVGLHALTDAILGALSAGDIGQHFPPSDPKWKGADSALFLRHAMELVTARGGRFIHCDVTLICEAPKVGPHRAEMRLRVAEILNCDPERVNIKATTTERLGFTGRGEGIAAQATASLLLPPTADPQT